MCLQIQGENNYNHGRPLCFRNPVNSLRLPDEGPCRYKHDVVRQLECAADSLCCTRQTGAGGNNLPSAQRAAMNPKSSSWDKSTAPWTKSNKLLHAAELSVKSSHRWRRVWNALCVTLTINQTLITWHKDGGVLAAPDMKGCVTQAGLRGSAGCPGHTHTHFKHKHLPNSVFLVHRLIVHWVCVCVSTSTADHTEHVVSHSHALWDWTGKPYSQKKV